MTPAANQNGTTTLTVTVSDGSLTGQDTFLLTVTAVNDTPVLSGVSLTTAEDTTYTFISSFFTNAYTDADSDVMSGIRLVTVPNGTQGTIQLA